MINLIHEIRAVLQAVGETRRDLAALRSEVSQLRIEVALQTKECDQPHFPCLRQHCDSHTMPLPVPLIPYTPVSNTIGPLPLSMTRLPRV